MRDRRRRPDRAELVEVEIADSWDERPSVAGDLPEPDDGPAPPTPGGPTRPRGLRRFRPALLAAAAVTVVVVGVNVVDAVRRSAEEAALAEVEGVVADLAEPPQELWRLDDTYVIGETGELLLVFGAGDGQARGIDPSDGSTVWERPAPADGGHPESCSPYYGGTGSAVEYLICAPLSYEGGLPEPGVRTLITTVRAATGEDVADSTVEGVLVEVTPHDGALVATTVDSAGRVRVTRYDHLTGDPEWLHEGAPGTVGEDRSVATYWTGGAVQVITHDTAAGDAEPTELFTLDAVTGEPATDTEGEPDWSVDVVLPDGATATVVGDDDGPRTTVADDDGVRFELDGYPMVFGTDDGSVPEVLVLTNGGGGELRAHDAGTGAVLWEREVEGFVQPLVRIRGVVVVAGARSILAVDLRSGDLLWELDQSVPSFAGVTDGHTFVTTDETGLRGGDDDDLGLPEAGGAALVALDLREGTEVWRMAIPDGSSIRGVGGVILLENGAALTGLG